MVTSKNGAKTIKDIRIWKEIKDNFNLTKPDIFITPSHL